MKKLLFASLSLLCALSLSKLDARPAYDLAPASAPAIAVDNPAAHAARTAPDDGDRASCPFTWLCDATGGVYDTLAACRAECPGPCTVEVYCDGFCICP